VSTFVPVKDISLQCERCWILIGQEEGKLWWAKPRKESKGQPASVGFDAAYVLKREEEKGDVIGMLHTHPGFSSHYSDRDDRTARAWADALGKEILILIRGEDGLRGWWFPGMGDGDPVECEVLRVGYFFIGTTETDYS
jgi:Prokaryotic homologs of the JAB domain